MIICRNKSITADELYRVVDEANENNGSLYLDSLTSLPEGLSLTVGESLYLSSLTSLPEGVNLTAGESLYLNSLTSLPEGLSLTVGESLDLNSLTSLPEGVNLTAGGSLFLNSLTSLPKGVSLTAGGWLDLSSLTSLPKGVSLTAGGSLDLNSLTSLPEGVNLTAGGSLFLNSLTSLPEGVSLTAGGWLYLSGKRVKRGYKKLSDGDYVPCEYLYADGILTHVKRDKRIGAYTYYVGKIPGYDVISDGTNYAHCGSVRDGISELAFKTAKDRGAEQYRSVNIDEEIPTEDAMVMYRVITGACQQGTKRFVDSLPEVRDRYSVRQIIDMTRDQYGGEAFRRFFEG